MLISFVDWVSGTALGGWAYDTLCPDHAPTIEIYCNGVLVGSALCDQERADLPGIRGGLCGYSFKLSDEDFDTLIKPLAMGVPAGEIYCVSGPRRARVNIANGLLHKLRTAPDWARYREVELVGNAVIRADNALSLYEGKNSHTSHIFGKMLIEPEVVQYWADLVELCSRLGEKHGFRFLFVMHASKESVEGYADNLTPSPDRPAMAILNGVDRRYRRNIHYNYWTLVRNRIGEPKFMARDTHMNGLGVYLSYVDFCRRLGVPEEAIVPFEATTMTLELVKGDLFGHLEFHPEIAARFPEQGTTFISNPLVKSYPGEYKSHETPHIDYRNPNAFPGELLVFGRSMAHMMMSLLLESFSRVDYNHTYALDFEKIESGAFETVAMVLPERYLTRLHRMLVPKEEIARRLQEVRAQG